MFSQTIYQPGYFITNSGDKISCLIKNEEWMNNPTEFTYKIDLESASQTGKIKDIAQFGIDGDKSYRRFEATIDLSSNTISSLSFKKEPEWTKRIVYLEIITEGKLTLYRYEQGDILKYFFISNDYITAEQLVFKKYSINGNVAENNNFRQQLYNLMKDKYEDKEKFKSIKYEQKELEKLFKEYNGTDNIKTDKKKQKGKISLKLTAGTAIAKLEMQHLVSGEHYNFNDKTIFGGGAEFEYTLPFNNKKWSLFINPNIQFYKNSSQKDYYVADVDYTYLQIPLGMRYNMFLNDKAKIFLTAAYVFNINVGSEMIYSNRDLPVVISNGSSIMAGAGFSYLKYSAEIRYNTKYGIINGSNWASDYSTLGIVLAYNII